MGIARLTMEWDAIAMHWASVINAMGGTQDGPVDPLEIHPFRKQVKVESDFRSFFERLMNNGG